MIDGKTGLTAAGLTPDGARNRLIAADANLWPYLAGLAPLHEHAMMARWAGRAAIQPASASARRAMASGSKAPPSPHWPAPGGRDDLARRFNATIAANIAPSGYVYATVPPHLSTGLTIGPGADSPKFLYFRRPALAPTAWAALLSEGANPLEAG